MTGSDDDPGYVVTERIAHATGRLKRRLVAWTRHEPDCSMLRAKTRQPAPATPYPNTVDCAYCRPGSAHRTGLPIELPDGTWQAHCRCGMSSTGPTRKRAVDNLGHRHRAAARRAERKGAA